MELDGPSLSKLRHDLRTPINHILGYSELLEEDLADQGIKELGDLEKIRAAGRQLLHLIDQSLSGDSLQTATLAAAPETEAVRGIPTALTEEPEVNIGRAAVTGHILIVDDNEENRTVLARHLRRQGHTTSEAADGRLALEAAAAGEYDLILLDVIMPELDGYSALMELKASETLRHLPVIMISALDELRSVVRCIEAGAEDYLPKPFNPTLLRARIGASLEKKRLRDQEQTYLAKIEETQRRLQEELNEAGRYVTSILPPPMEEPFRITWDYAPSTELGGDSFGYHWIDDRYFAVYLLDVCGHGVGAALLSVAAINVIRSGSLPKVDFTDPASVLAGLNESFQMDRHNGMYFTIWYGVYDKVTRRLRHASGGHPPALLFGPGETAVESLRCPGVLIGALPGVTYQSDTVELVPGSRLCVYCDGAYEIKRPDGSMIDFEEDFVPYLTSISRSANLPVDVLGWIRSVHGEGPLDDDYSFVVVDFP